MRCTDVSEVFTVPYKKQWLVLRTATSLYAMTPPTTTERIHPSGRIDRHILNDSFFLTFACNDSKRKKQTNKKNTKINGLNKANRVASFPLSELRNSICFQECTVSCGCLRPAAAACTFHSGFTGSEIRVCKCLDTSSPSTE